jgi:hypothetical protein
MDFDRVQDVMSDLDYRSGKYRRFSQEAAEKAENAEKSNDWQTPEAKVREVVLYEVRAENYTHRARDLEDMSRRLSDALYPETGKDREYLMDSDTVRDVMVDMWHLSQECSEVSREMRAVIERSERAGCWKTPEAKARGQAYYGTHEKDYAYRAREFEELAQELREALYPEEYEGEEEEGKEAE